MSMQSREPMWFCHECNAEMRPLMIPDPHCASCRGTFVEKIENLDDDPREFHNAEAELDEGLGPFSLLASLNGMLRDRATPGADSSGRRAASSSPTRDRSATPSQGPTLRFEFGGPNNRRTVLFGGSSMMHHRDSETNANASNSAGPPRLSEFLRANSESGPRDMNIPGQLMAQYLMALLAGGPFGGRGMSPFSGPVGMNDEHGQGHWGDYVFTQEALDQIITQMMESANSTRPVPASEEIVENLPREVLEEGSPLLEKDCAVCKEQFNAKTEDPDEQIVVTLPCMHPFHEGCILPWLKSSGTCPVCRYALVPQPNAHPMDPGPSSGHPTSSAGRRPPNGGGSNSGTGGPTAPTAGNATSGTHGGFFSTFFGGHNRSGSHDGPSDRSGNSHSTSHSVSPSRDRRQRHGSRGGSGGSADGHGIPGGWADSLD